MGRLSEFRSRGWIVFPPEPAVSRWVQHATEAAIKALRDPTLADQYACEGTWFVGIDALPNDERGRVADSAPLDGAAVDFIGRNGGGWPDLHRAQVSGVFPGYPKSRDGESEAGFAYRLHRDAAHVDGVIGIGAPKRRFVQEPHAFILGLPLTWSDEDAAPLVVWEGSHRAMQHAFRQVFDAAAEARAEEVDVTEAYTAARRAVFDRCPRRRLVAPPGSAILLHRMLLHGVAPFATGAQADAAGRLIAYFRPPMPGGARAWAVAP